MNQDILSQARRFYHHVVNGGKLKPEDVSYMVSALEEAYEDHALTFEEWLNEIECYGSRQERLGEELPVSDALIKWLRAAYEVGYEQGRLHYESQD